MRWRSASRLDLLLAGPADAFNLFPKTATSQSARDKLNKKTDDLPSVAETGKELAGGSDPIGASDPKDVGKAVDKYVPHCPSFKLSSDSSNVLSQDQASIACQHNTARRLVQSRGCHVTLLAALH